MNARLPAAALDAAQARSQINALWDTQIVPQLADYIRIPAKSPLFDADWAANGHIDAVVRHTATWIEAQKVEGLTLEIVRLPGRTPVLFFEVAARQSTSDQTVLVYGHLDKQPSTPGRSAQIPRTHNWTRTPACEAR